MIIESKKLIIKLQNSKYDSKIVMIIVIVITITNKGHEHIEIVYLYAKRQYT